MQEFLIRTRKPFYWKSTDDFFELTKQPFQFIRCFAKDNKIMCTFYGDDASQAEKNSLCGYSDLIFVEMSSSVTLNGEKYPCKEYKCLNKHGFSDDSTIDNHFSKQAASWGASKGRNYLHLSFSCFHVFERDFFKLNLSYRNDIYRSSEYSISNYKEIEEWKQKLIINYYHPVQQLFFLIDIFKNNNPLVKDSYPSLKDFIAYADSKRSDYECIDFNKQTVEEFLSLYDKPQP